jgi:3-deoxy-D-manno-octulosonic-acid transferase
MIFYVLIYRLAISLYSTAIRIATPFNNKARLFINGRKGLLEHIRQTLAGETRQSVWMHCASLGEFEQGRPVIEEIRRQYPGFAIIITFFSPSGYEVRKEYDKADYVFYLPLDSDTNAKEFLDIINPALCIFVKYEFWFFYLSNISSRKIPVILISALFTKKQEFFKWYGALQRRMLHSFSHIFVQDIASMDLLKTIKVANVSVGGDTRFDRVVEAAEQVDDLPSVTAFCNNHKVIVAGSTWKQDEVFLQKTFALLPSGWKLILAPHEVDDDHIAAIEKLFPGSSIRLSRLTSDKILADMRVLIVDKVGVLLQIYRYGSVAWIGGGFGKEGVHNVLEPAVYGIPCFYGPIFHQFMEARELITKGGAFSVDDPKDIVGCLKEFNDQLRYQQHAAAAREYVYAGTGATGKVMAYLYTYLAEAGKQQVK